MSRGVLDHDGDGVSDVVVAYVRIREGFSDANPNDPRSWEDLGIGVFYGPITGDIALGDEGTQHILGRRPVPHAQPSFVGGGAARTLVGDVCGDETEDVVIGLSSGPSTRSAVLPRWRKPRRPDRPRRRPPRLSAVYDRIRLMDDDRCGRRRRCAVVCSRWEVVTFTFFAPNLQGIDATPGVLVNRVALWYDTAPDTPLFTHFGGAMGDLDGDGAAGRRAGQPGTRAAAGVVRARHLRLRRVTRAGARADAHHE
jgi:hypothetical protein